MTEATSKYVCLMSGRYKSMAAGPVQESRDSPGPHFYRRRVAGTVSATIEAVKSVD